ncbi:MAG TPA: alpha/beta hydrolase [Clostridia bacterium]|nr:alpha/beta hydrolase [Clostridia bacterium]
MHPLDSAERLSTELQARSELIDRGSYLELFTQPVMKQQKMLLQLRGLIFYPGGKVANEAYLPFLVMIAEAGYPVFLAKMPLDLAVFRIGGVCGGIHGRAPAVILFPLLLFS